MVTWQWLNLNVTGWVTLMQLLLSPTLPLTSGYFDFGVILLALLLYTQLHLYLALIN